MPIMRSWRGLIKGVAEVITDFMQTDVPRLQMSLVANNENGSAFDE
jgi:hypothetical protein